MEFNKAFDEKQNKLGFKERKNLQREIVKLNKQTKNMKESTRISHLVPQVFQMRSDEHQWNP